MLIAKVSLEGRVNRLVLARKIWQAVQARTLHCEIPIERKELPLREGIDSNHIREVAGLSPGLANGFDLEGRTFYFPALLQYLQTERDLKHTISFLPPYDGPGQGGALSMDQTARWILARTIADRSHAPSFFPTRLSFILSAHEGLQFDDIANYSMALIRQIANQDPGLAILYTKAVAEDLFPENLERQLALVRHLARAYRRSEGSEALLNVLRKSGYYPNEG